ncbi:hypothetical protein JCGZ_02307 [Jatropha curcas]|uniref:Fe2OG dioxygenase domain-containing protein n=1 Tax=Jatropha curcas TaxID=180498 RepID=A0A067L896_JATCU|nr:hypothetical protein JCGZ_02307 [Jatropha curcas]
MRPPEDLAEELHSRQADMAVPVIDLSDIQKDKRRKEIIEEVRLASGKWGFFQVVNHEIPLGIFDEMINGVRLFNEQDLEVKKKFYSRDLTRKVRFNSNYDLYSSRFANWRDTLTISMPDHLDPEELPATCSCHYYPACPDPELTLGASKHTDPGMVTLLLQSQICSLQVLQDGQWVNVQPIPGSLVINMGDILKIISNDKFKSVEHKVIANRDGPRISVACFFTGSIFTPLRTYSPIKELTSEYDPVQNNPYLNN